MLTIGLLVFGAPDAIALPFRKRRGGLNRTDGTRLAQQPERAWRRLALQGAEAKLDQRKTFPSL
jgi:hypothetical protein